MKMMKMMKIASLLSLLIGSQILSFGQNFGSRFSSMPKWPEKVEAGEIEFRVVKDDVRNKRFAYATNHFELKSLVRLKPQDAEQIMLVFETTYAAMKVMPYGLDKRIPKDLDVTLFASHDAYVKAGGYRFDIARYDIGEEVLLLSPKILDAKIDASGNTVLGELKADLIVKEVSEQLLADNEFPYWLKEGIAHYMQLAPYNNGALYLAKVDVAKELKGSRMSKILKMDGLMSQKGIIESKVMDKGPAYLDSKQLASSGFVWVAYILQLSDPEVGERFAVFLDRAPGSWQRGVGSLRILTEHSSGTTMDQRISVALKSIGVKRVQFYSN
jgi:hypothetical protein